MKNLIRKAEDPYKALMAYRATPLECGLSPAELLMGRKIRTRIPTIPSQLQPTWPYLENFRDKDANLKSRQKRNFDARHSSKVLKELRPGNPVWLPNEGVDGKVVDKAGTPRSYIIETPKGRLRRNRRHINPLPETQASATVPETPACNNPVSIVSNNGGNTKSLIVHDTSKKVTRSGREVRPPERFRD